MTRMSLYRRFRPQRFADVRGQDKLASALQRAVAEDRVGQAYLLSGPRGTGKTTTARILAKALNCPDVRDGEPCGVCESCVAIAEGHSFDVFELDAASNNSVDAIRELIERSSVGTPGSRKVYILDEVHMLSKSAANALLKTLEEPPDHVVFVLATTDPQKLLPTIRSRTQHYEVHLLDAAELAALVDQVDADAELGASDEVKRWAVRTGAGSARDTLSALERAVALGGVPDAVTEVDAIVDAFGAHDTATALTAVATAVRAGRNPQDVGNELIERLRHVFLTAMGAAPTDLPSDVIDTVTAQAGVLGARGATHALEVLGQALAGIHNVPDPRVPLELAMVRITQPQLDTSSAALLSRIERLEQALAGGAVAPAAGHTPSSGHAVADAAPTTSAAPNAPTTQPTDDPGYASDQGTPSGSPADVPAGDDPAAAARHALAAKRKQGGGPAKRTPPRPATAPAGSAPPPPPPPPPTPSPPRPPAPAAAAPPEAPATATPQAPPAAPPEATPAAASEPTPAATPPSAGSFDIAMIDSAWQRQVVNSADQKVRARFGAGRVKSVQDSTVTIALPNERVLQRCDPLRLQVQQLLSTDLDAVVSLQLVVDSAAAAQPEPTRPGGRPSPSAAPPVDDSDAPHADEDIGDVHQLADATDHTVDAVQRITDVFPGTELVDIDQETPP
jgi:DNA polymerase-3 subunit gamma/tau